jgi:hypothetical protein
VADEGAARVGVMLEQLTSRFELVIEAVTGLGGRIDSLRSEMFDQFAEVGKQIRFLSQQIGENREGLATLGADLTAEAVRLGEAITATRVEFRKQLADSQSALRSDIVAKLEQRTTLLHSEITAGNKVLGEEIAAKLEDRTTLLHGEIAATADETVALLRGEIAAKAEETVKLVRGETVAAAEETRQELRNEIARKTDAVTKQLTAEIKQTQKSIGSLSKKFDRFDDRVSVQVKDHDQRLRKLERRARA